MSKNPAQVFQDEFQGALNAYLYTVTKAVRDHFARNGFTFAVPGVRVLPPRGNAKYAKVVSTETYPEQETRDQGVHSFVSLATGEIFKPASWKAPAKHARGNIFDEDHGASALGAMGLVRYLG